YGSDEVPALAARAAGVPDPASIAAPTNGDGKIRYLLERDGLCAPAEGTSTSRGWSGISVHRIGDHHVGVRHDGEQTAEVLRRLLGDPIDDPRAGHSFSVSLDLAIGEPRRGIRPLSLLTQAGQRTLASRAPGRVLRALLDRITDGIDGL